MLPPLLLRFIWEFVCKREWGRGRELERGTQADSLLSLDSQPRAQSHNLEITTRVKIKSWVLNRLCLPGAPNLYFSKMLVIPIACSREGSILFTLKPCREDPRNKQIWKEQIYVRLVWPSRGNAQEKTFFLKKKLKKKGSLVKIFCRYPQNKWTGAD